MRVLTMLVGKYVGSLLPILTSDKYIYKEEISYGLR